MDYKFHQFLKPYQDDLKRQGLSSKEIEMHSIGANNCWNNLARPWIVYLLEELEKEREKNR